VIVGVDFQGVNGFGHRGLDRPRIKSTLTPIHMIVALLVAAG
jgi:hypothetical protein